MNYRYNDSDSLVVLEKHRSSIETTIGSTNITYIVDELSAQPMDSMSIREIISTRFFSLVGLFYIDKLVGPRIAHIGCQENMFKGVFPEIEGYDPFHPNADVNVTIDSEFLFSNFETFDSAFSINYDFSENIKTTDMKQNIEKFASIIKPGGYGYLAFNSNRLLDLPDMKDSDVPNLLNIINSANVEVLDIFVQASDVVRYNGIEGNTRVFFRKPVV